MGALGSKPRGTESNSSATVQIGRSSATVSLHLHVQEVRRSSSLWVADSEAVLDLLTHYTAVIIGMGSEQGLGAYDGTSI